MIIHRVSRALVLLGALALLGLPAQAQTNLSLMGTAISSSESGPTRTTSYANDNDPSTRWQPATKQNEWVGIQWAMPVTFNKIVVQTAYDRFKHYKIQVLAPDNMTFIDVAEGFPPGTGNIQVQPIYTVVLPKPVTTTEVRFLILDSIELGGVRELQTFYVQGDDYNISLTGKAISSSESGPTRTTSYANDNDPSTRWQPATKQNEWVGIQWAMPVTFNKIVVQTAYDRFKHYKIQVLAPDNMTFIDVAEGFPPGTGNIQVQPIYTVLLPKPVTTTEVRFLILDSIDLGGVRELQTFNVAAGTISGTVTDASTKKPIAGATVVANPGAVTATTAADGTYSLILQAGTFDVRTTSPASPMTDGYFPITNGNIALTAGGTVTSDFALIPSVNLARKAQADDSSEDMGSMDTLGNTFGAAALAIDGDLTTAWRTSGGNMDEWVRLTWPMAQTFNFLVVTEAGDFVQQWALESFDKGMNNFVPLSMGTAPATGDNRLDYTFAALVDPPVTSDQVRFHIMTGTGIPGVREFQVYKVDTGTISGVVTDATTMKPLANIDLEAAAGPLKISATTDANGKFSFKVPVGPSVDLTASRLQTPSTPGYVANSAHGVTVAPGGTTTVQIALNPSPANLAFLAMASASTEAMGHPAGMANDGQAQTFWQYDTGDTDRWLQYDWTTPQTFNQVVVSGIGQIPGFDINAYDDAMMMLVRVGGGDHAVPVPGTQDIIVNFPMPVTTKQLQLVIKSPLSGTQPPIYELQVFNITSLPAAPAPIISNGGTPPGGMVVIGDLNGNGKIDIGDATLALRIGVGLQAATSAQTAAAGTHAINVAFATVLLRAAIGLGAPPM